MKRLCLALALLSLWLGLNALAEGKDPVVVRVGDVAYAKSLVQFAYTSSLDVVSAYEDAVSDEDREALRDNAVERMVDLGIIENKLMELYSADHAHQSADDPGAQLHPESTNWPETFRDAAAALKKPGDISAPVVTDKGVSIIRYMGDVPSGPHPLTAQEREALEQAAVYDAKLRRLEALSDEWAADYEIETHPELIDLE